MNASRRRLPLILLAAAALAAAAGLFFLQGGPEPEAPVLPPAPAVLRIPDFLAVQDGGIPEASSVRIRSGSGREWASLEKGPSGWTDAVQHGAPADRKKAERLLVMAAEAFRQAAAGGEAAELPPGYSSDSLAVITLSPSGGGEAVLRIGPHPAGELDAVYAEADFPEAETRRFLFRQDLRGAAGLWGDSADAEPERSFWLQTRVLSFPPEQAAAVTVSYPDHTLIFRRSAGGEWELDGPAPGGRWNPDALLSWIRDAADFRAASAAEPGAHGDGTGFEPLPTHQLEIVLEDGSSRLIRMYPDPAGGGMFAWTSEYPDQLFTLPQWRFRRLFQRMDELFPGAVPVFAAEDVRILDLRRGGESVRLVRADGEWRAPSAVFPVRGEAADRLVRALAAWRAEDFAVFGGMTVRIAYGGPAAEVILASGETHRYRLGGWHPVFPWRYVVVDGDICLAGTEEKTAPLFPSFAEILDLGSVFRDMETERLARLEFSRAGELEPLFTAVRIGGGWEGRTASGAFAMTETETEKIIAGLAAWQPSGLFEEDVRAAGRLPNAIFRIRLTAENGSEQTVTLLAPNGRDLPYLHSRGRALRLSLGDFLSWTRSIREACSRAAPGGPEKPDGAAGTDAARPGIPDLTLPAGPAYGEEAEAADAPGGDTQDTEPEPSPVGREEDSEGDISILIDDE